MAKNWNLVKLQAWWISPNCYSQPLPPTGADATIIITQADLKQANFEILKHITVMVNFKHKRQGNLQVSLIIPHGTILILANLCRHDSLSTGTRSKILQFHFGDVGPIAWVVFFIETMIRSVQH